MPTQQTSTTTVGWRRRNIRAAWVLVPLVTGALTVAVDTAFAAMPPVGVTSLTARVDTADTFLAAKAKRKTVKKKKGQAGAASARGTEEEATSSKGASRARDKALPRQIKKEQELAPKKEVQLDEQISKTKDLKPVGDTGKGPALSAEDLEKRSAEAMVDSKLDEEIGLTRQLLAIETECNEASPARFRLGDLYWEKSKRAFFKANDFNTAARDRDRYSQQMKDLQAQSVGSYEKIVNDCSDFSDLAKVLYYLGKALMEVDRSKEGAAYFKRVIQQYPKSPWVAHSWFMIGEYYFNFGNDAVAALKAYTKAAEFPQTSTYGYAIYKMGWCYINTGDWDKALERFKQVVTISEDQQQDLEQRARLALRKEALRDYVRAYSNIGDSKVALKNFYAIGGKDSLQMMMEQLGNWYISRDGHYDTVTVFRDLIKSYARSTRLAVWQGRIVDATSRKGDRKQTVVEAKKLTEFFADLRSRRERNDLSVEEQKTIAKDVGEAEEIAENTLRRLAFEYYKESNKLKGQAGERTLRLAQDLHRHYLDVFPEAKKDAEVNYVFYVRFQYADILYKVEEFEEAAKNYDMVVDMNPHPTREDQKKIVLAAAEEAVRSYDELVQDLDRKNPPQISGTEPKEIPPVKQKLINACQRYIQYVGSEGEKIVEIRYKMARIYYTYNHFDKAAPAFNDIVTNHPGNQVACYSANLVLDIYNGRKDYKSLRQSARAYGVNTKLACGEEDKKRFAQIEESSSFQLIKTEYEEKKKYILAGDEYMAFYRAFPKSQYGDDAVYNAAVNYDLGNKLDKANQVREFLVKTYPDSPLVPETLYNIAQSYERIVDFDNAAKYLEQFASRFPSDKRSKDAVYNAGLYRATLGDYAGGKAGREKYIKLYPGDADVHQVAFAICESLEAEAESLEHQQKGGKGAASGNALVKWQQAHDCYFSYIKNSSYARADTDRLCQAQYRRLEIMRTKTNYEKGVQELKKYIATNWPKWKRAGLEKLPRCAEAVAEIQLRELEGAFKRYDEIAIAELNPTDAGKKKFDASIKAKILERDSLIEDYKKVVEVGVVEPALTALYYIGEAHRESINALLKAPIPDKIPGYKLSKEDKQLLRDQLREKAAPIEEKALEAYRVCVQKSNEFGVYNKWSVKALERLHVLRPDEYPVVLEKVESVRFGDKLVVARNSIVIADGDTFKSVDVPFGAKGAAGASDNGKATKKKEEPISGETSSTPPNDGAPGATEGSAATQDAAAGGGK